jgi:RNA recognition motif-containing protein
MSDEVYPTFSECTNIPQCEASCGCVNDDRESKEEEISVVGDREERDSRSVFISNIDLHTTQEHIHEHFSPCGKIASIVITKVKGSEYKRKVFLEFEDIFSVDNGLLLNGSILGGRTIRVLPKRTNIRNFAPRNAIRGNAIRNTMHPPYPTMFHPNTYESNMYQHAMYPNIHLSMHPRMNPMNMQFPNPQFANPHYANPPMHSNWTTRHNQPWQTTWNRQPQSWQQNQLQWINQQRR